MQTRHERLTALVKELGYTDPLQHGYYECAHVQNVVNHITTEVLRTLKWKEVSVREIKDAICAVSELKNNDNDHKLGV